MGSVAYGVADTSGDNAPDFDIYGVCVPPKETLFPHLTGELWGFGKYKDGMPNSYFRQWQQAHINDPDALGGKGREYDFQIYSIVQYFQLCMECNPNMIDSLFTHDSDVLHITQIGRLIRDNKQMFLSQKIFEKFKGYAFSQWKKIETKKAEENSKRAVLIEKYGMDTKYCYHLVRLLLECEDLLRDGTMDIKRHREQLKAIRRGEYTLEKIHELMQGKMNDLETLRNKSVLPPNVDQKAIRNLLIQCLEIQYGDLSKAVTVPSSAEDALRDIKELIAQRGY
jgi:predicted nucleotidyltransferase